MKNHLRSLSLFVIFLTLFTAFTRGPVAALLVYCLGNLAVFTLAAPARGVCFTPTLILPILTGKVFEAFKPTAVPMLDMISTDWGRPQNGFVQPVKFGQEVISQLASIPNVTRTTPGGLLTTPQVATGLATDLSVTIDRMAAVKVRLPSQDVQQLMVNQVFMQACVESGQKLARFMCYDVFRAANSGRNLTNVFTAAAPDLDTLDTQRQTLTNNKAGTPRFGIGTTAFLGRVGADPRVQLQYGFNQRIGNDPIASFTNLYGLNRLQEIQDFPSGNRALGTMTCDHTVNGGTFTIVTLNQASGDADTMIDPTIDFANGMRVQVTSTGGNVPANLDALGDEGGVPVTYYFIRDYVPDADNGVLGGSGVGGTFRLSATLGGAAFAVGDNGSGTLNIIQAENLECLFFEQRALHVASRPMIDPSEAARTLGIPLTMLVGAQQDKTGVSLLSFMWQDTAGQNPTLDIFVAWVIQYGVRAGRGISLRPTVSLDPTTAAPNSGFDRCALRCITA